MKAKRLLVFASVGMICTFALGIVSVADPRLLAQAQFAAAYTFWPSQIQAES